jgi:ATP-dependent Clp protease ATP-binding subunit ClpB
VNRIDDIVRFRPLTEADLVSIVDIQLAGLGMRLAERRLSLVVTDEAKEALAAKGFDPAFGARPLKRLIQREIGDRMALAVLEGRYLEGDTVTVDIEPDLSLPLPGERDGDKAMDNSAGLGQPAEQMPEAAIRTFVLR